MIALIWHSTIVARSDSLDSSSILVIVFVKESKNIALVSLYADYSIALRFHRRTFHERSMRASQRTVVNKFINYILSAINTVEGALILHG